MRTSRAGTSTSRTCAVTRSSPERLAAISSSSKTRSASRLDGFRSGAERQQLIEKMRILLVGGGGREHAIGWKLRQSSRVDRLMSLPGNPGLAELGSVIEGIDPNNVGGVATMAGQLGVDLVVVGPEAPLAAGSGRRPRPRQDPRLGTYPGGRPTRIVEEVRQGGDGPGRGRHRPWEAFTDGRPGARVSSRPARRHTS